jgi:hypothetical protein
MRERYLSLRRRYQPETTRLAIVAESPPVSGLYFYDAAGKITEPLFAAVMQQHQLSPGTKEEGLRALQQRGWILVDSTYQPVNGMDERRKTATIVGDYSLLRDDLRSLAPEYIVLIKANVCSLLEPRLKADGFSALNAGRKIHFPSHGRQGDFHRQFADVAAPALARLSG